MSEPLIIAPYRRGSGAGLARGTRLATTRGLLPVEDVAPGDAVCLADGGTAPVTAVVPLGPQPAVHLQVQGGYALVAAAAQPVWVFTPQGAFAWRPLADLRPGDVVVLQPGRGLPPDLSSVPLPPCRPTHPNNHQTLVTPALADEDLAFFLGYIVGNGTLSVASRLSWTVNLRDHAFVLGFNAEAARRFGVPVRPARPYQGAQTFHLFSVPLRRWLAVLGLAKDRVPDVVWRSRASVVAAFLRGYFSADGCATDDATGRVSVTSSRPRIIAEVQALLLALGVPASRRTQRHTGPGRRHTAHHLAVMAAGLPAFAAQIGFALPRRQQKLEALLRRWRGKCVYGGMPHLRDKVRALGLSGHVRQLLNNTASLGRPVSPALAARVAALDPAVAEALGLHHVLHYGRLFLPVRAVEAAGMCETYVLRGPRAAVVAGGFLVGAPPD
jgi:hypothetical protein